MTRTFTFSSEIDATVDEVWDWHARPGALHRLAPPWERVIVTGRDGGIGNGDRTSLEVGWGPLRMQWVAEHRDSERGRGFTDVMVSGPFAAWTHRHSFDAAGEGCRLTDHVEYRLPGGSLREQLMTAHKDCR